MEIPVGSLDNQIFKSPAAHPGIMMDKIYIDDIGNGDPVFAFRMYPFSMRNTTRLFLIFPA